MTPIQATDSKDIPSTIETVWKVLTDFPAYPSWWPRSVGLRVLEVDPRGVGSSFRLRPFGGRAFNCRVESIESPSRILMRYYGGFIEGTGQWSLYACDSGTRVSYQLDVVARGRVVAWMSRVLPLASFHSWQMQGVLHRLKLVAQSRET